MKAHRRLSRLCWCISLSSFVTSSTIDFVCNSSIAEQAALARWSPLSELTFSRDSHAAATFGDKVWIVGGVSAPYYTKRLEHTITRSDVISSVDGIEWTEVLEEAPFRRRYGHSLTVFTDSSDNIERLVLLGGFTPEPATDIWVSTDGATWTQATANVPWAGRGFHCSVAFGGKLWVLGGSPFNNEIWSTSSVLTGPWKQEMNAPWSPRAAHACAAHQVMVNATTGDVSREDFLFLMGGWRETSLRDVWRMDASGHWTLLAEAPWEPRAWFALVSFDSRTNSDVQLGPRLWVFGGGIVGNGIGNMYPYSDVWYTRDGKEWVQASSNSSGTSTAEWSIVKQNNVDVCMGKWGHTVVSFYRNVERAYYCHPSCTNEQGTISLANQLIPVCDPSTRLPELPIRRTIVRNSSMFTTTIYPDGCGLCKTESNSRYKNSTRVPTLLLLAGNVGIQKANEVFQSSDGMLCEKDGKICSGDGVCVQGGTCLCNSGKTGSNCDDKVDYTIVEPANCFPESAPVISFGGKIKRLGDVKIGDSLLSLDAAGELVYSTVYYIPHESVLTDEMEYIRVTHDGMGNHIQDFVEPLQLTPKHLVYYLTENKFIINRPAYDAHSLMPSLAQKPASELQVGDLLLWLPCSPPRSCLHQIDNSNPANTSSSCRCSSPDDQDATRAGPSFVRVSNLSRVTQSSAKTVYTMTGNFFVAGVLCSNFGDYYPTLPGQRWRDFVAFMLFAPHRAMFGLFPFESTANLLRLVMDQLVVPALTWFRLHISQEKF